MRWSRRDVMVRAGMASVPWLVGCGHKVAKQYGPAPNRGVRGRDSLQGQAAQHGLLTGFAVVPKLLQDDAAYATVVREQASIVVAENAMKFGPLRPSPRDFFWNDADALVGFVEKNHIKLRGHNFVWHKQLANWFEGVATKDNARQLLVEHIRTVGGRYAGRMHSWDVVNEAIDVKDGRADGLRKSPWLELAGDDYIELAFRTAREADPDALLTYNEYGIEAESYDDEQKRSAVLLLLRRMKARQVPIDAVGIQSHITAKLTYGYGVGLQRFMASLREMGLQVFLTEMDVNDKNVAAPIAIRDEVVADTYAKYLAVTLQEPAVKAVLFWGVNDGHTWLNGIEHGRTDKQPERPLLFGPEYKPTASFFAVREAFQQRVPGMVRATKG